MIMCSPSKYTNYVNLLENFQEFKSEKIVAAEAGIAVLKFMKRHGALH